MKKSFSIICLTSLLLITAGANANIRVTDVCPDAAGIAKMQPNPKNVYDDNQGVKWAQFTGWSYPLNELKAPIQFDHVELGILGLTYAVFCYYHGAGGKQSQIIPSNSTTSSGMSKSPNWYKEDNIPTCNGAGNSNACIFTLGITS